MTFTKNFLYDLELELSVFLHIYKNPKKLIMKNFILFIKQQQNPFYILIDHINTSHHPIHIHINFNRTLQKQNYCFTFTHIYLNLMEFLQ